MTTLCSSGVQISAKGSLIVSNASGQTAELTVGSDGTVLIADSSQPNGLGWTTSIPFQIGNFSSSAVVRGSTSAGTATYTNQFMYVTLFAPLVIIYAQIEFNSFTGTGDLQIPLPYGVGFSQTSPAIGYGNFDAAFSGTGDDIAFLASGGNDFATIGIFGSDSTLTTQECVPEADIRLTIIYSLV